MAKINVVKFFEFEAAHFLPNYDGCCKNIHGHTYKLQIGITGDINHVTGMVQDFSTLKQTVKKAIIDHLDHKMLNEITLNNFPHKNPTAENMVVWMKGILENTLACDIYLIRLYETSTSYAEWRKTCK